MAGALSLAQIGADLDLLPEVSTSRLDQRSPEGAGLLHLRHVALVRVGERVIRGWPDPEPKAKPPPPRKRTLIPGEERRRLKAAAPSLSARTKKGRVLIKSRMVTAT